MENVDELLREIRCGLLKWYEFNPDADVLYVGSTNDDFAEIFDKKRAKVTFVSSESDIEKLLPQKEKFFRYIVTVETFEAFRDVAYAFRNFCRLLQPKGIFLLGANNRMGLRFWCGERDLYTGGVLDGIDGYVVERPVHGRMYSRGELAAMLGKAGFEKMRFYAVLPNLEYPMIIYREDFVPREDLANRLFPLYSDPTTVYLKEEAVCASIAAEGALPAFANAFFIECSPKGNLQDVLQVTISAERGKENALCTVVKEKIVEKQAYHPAGMQRLRLLSENIIALNKQGIKTVTGKFVGNKYIMPYVTAETGQIYLKNLLLVDKDKFVNEMDAFRSMILNSSEHLKEDLMDGEGVILNRGFIDLIPLNSFHTDDGFVVFDQEYCQKSCPANFIIARMLLSFYAGNAHFNDIIPLDFFLKRYQLEKNWKRWLEMADNFIAKLRNMDALMEYTNSHRCNEADLSANRIRMNVAQRTYDNHIRNMLDNAAERKLILFGSGKYAQSFLQRFGQDYPVYAIIDNNKAQHGKKLNGIQISPPHILQTLSIAEFKVVICVKDYTPISKQLEEQGIFFYGIYVPSFNYSFSHRQIETRLPVTKKKYHLGYIAGVFDLYHIGHLNLFRRAKEECNYLIVGVVTDKQARECKKVEPFVPFSERVAMIRSCRYVDEVVEIPFDTPDTDYAWQRYHFDVQFSGSDYEHDARWLEKKTFLEAHGATMVFFPYTESTSSTKLKKLIEKKLL